MRTPNKEVRVGGSNLRRSRSDTTTSVQARRVNSNMMASRAEGRSQVKPRDRGTSDNVGAMNRKVS